MILVSVSSVCSVGGIHHQSMLPNTCSYSFTYIVAIQMNTAWAPLNIAACLPTSAADLGSSSLWSMQAISNHIYSTGCIASSGQRVAVAWIALLICSSWFDYCSCSSPFLGLKRRTLLGSWRIRYILLAVAMDSGRRYHFIPCAHFQRHRPPYHRRIRFRGAPLRKVRHNSIKYRSSLSQLSAQPSRTPPDQHLSIYPSRTEVFRDMRTPSLLLPT